MTKPVNDKPAEPAAAADGAAAAAAAAPAAKPKAEKGASFGGQVGGAMEDAAPRKVVPLQITRCQLGEFMNARFSVSPASNTPFEDLLRPEYWANIVRMRPGDIVEVRPEDQSYYAELYVLSRSRNSATVAIIREPVKLLAAYRPGAGDILHTVEYSGSFAKWRVIRKSDQAVIRDRFENEADARAFLAQHERLVA